MKNALLKYIDLHVERTEIYDGFVIRYCKDIICLSVDREDGAIFLVGEAKNVYESLQARTDIIGRDSYRTLNRYFKYFLFGYRMDDRQFRREGRHSHDGCETALWAFKANQTRIYGVQLGKTGEHLFFGSSSDEKKKQDKANKQKLERAVRVYSKWLEILMHGQ